MRVARWVLGGVLGLFAIVVATVAITLVTLDTGRLGAEIARRASAALDREVRLGGAIEVAWSLRPTIEFADVAVANLPGGSRPAMLTVGRLGLRLAVLPLLKGQVTIESIEATGLDLLLERDAAGRANWELAGDPGAATPGAAGPPVGGGADVPGPGRLSIAALTVRNALVRYRADELHSLPALEIGSLEITSPGPGEPTRIQSTMAVGGVEVALAGETAPLATLLAASEIQGRMALTFLRTRLDIDGRAAILTVPVRIDATVRAAGADLALLRPLAGVALPAGPFELAARVHGDPGRLTIGELRVRSPIVAAAGAAVLELKAPRPRVELDLAVDVLDLRPLMAERPARASGVGGTAGQGAQPDGRVISDMPIDVAALRRLDGAAKVRIARLDALHAPITDIVLDVKLEAGRLQVTELAFGLAESRFAGNLGIEAALSPPRLAIELRTRDLDAEALLALAGRGDLLRARGGLDVKLAGSGADLRQLVGGLDGEIRFNLGRGEVRAGALDRLVGGVRQLAQTLLGQPAGVWVTLECAVADIAITKGTATARGFLVDTAVSTIAVTGTADLARERLDLLAVPRAKSATLSIAVPVTLRGTFAEPRIGIDEVGAARRIGALVGAFVFPPAALAAVADLGGGAGGCAAGAAPQGGGLPSGVGDAARQGRDAIEGVGRGLRDLLRR